MTERDLYVFMDNLKGRFYSMREDIQQLTIANTTLVQIPNATISLFNPSDDSVEITNIEVKLTDDKYNILEVKNILTSVYLSFVVTKNIRYITINMTKFKYDDLCEIIRLNTYKSLKYSVEGKKMTVDLSKLSNLYYKEYIETDFVKLKRSSVDNIVLNNPETIVQIPIQYMYEYGDMLNFDNFINNCNPYYYSFNELRKLIGHSVTDKTIQNKYLIKILQRYRIGNYDFEKCIIAMTNTLSDDDFFSLLNNSPDYNKKIVRMEKFIIDKKNIERFVKTYKVDDDFIYTYRDIIKKYRILDLIVEKNPELIDEIKNISTMYKVILWYRNFKTYIMS